MSGTDFSRLFGMLDHPAASPSRRDRLKSATDSVHAGLDARIMAGRPFASRDAYARFLAMQHRLHAAVASLYDDPTLCAYLPDLHARRRLPDIERDLADLGYGDLAVVHGDGDGNLTAGDSTGGDRTDGNRTGRIPGPAIGDVATALGWLYVVEGSTLGAAFLFKAAAALDLDANFGAHSLAAHPDGRALHWKSFVAALDAVPLTLAEDARVVEGARAAFVFADALAARMLPIPVAA